MVCPIKAPLCCSKISYRARENLWKFPEHELWARQGLAIPPAKRVKPRQLHNRRRPAGRRAAPSDLAAPPRRGGTRRRPFRSGWARHAYILPPGARMAKRSRCAGKKSRIVFWVKLPFCSEAILKPSYRLEAGADMARGFPPGGRICVWSCCECVGLSTSSTA